MKQAESFYKSARWLEIRESVLKRDDYLCRNCKRYGKRRQATTVHHIKHLDKYPELAYDRNNLVSLCDDCHNKAHPEKARGLARK